MAVRLGEVDEEKINNMAYIWFQSVLESMGKFINYESISNLYGNSFAKDAAKLIQAANPLIKQGAGGKNSAQTLLQMPGKTAIIRKDSADNKQMKDFLGDMEWILGK